MKPSPVETLSEGGLHIPDIAQMRPFSGQIVAAGLKAMDKMHDNGVLLGDTCWWGKFAGVVEQWTHLEVEGRVPCDTHEWSRQPTPGDRMSAMKCVRCDAVLLAEPLIVVMVDDLLVSEDLQRRLDAAQVVCRRGQTASGATQFYLSNPVDITVPTVVPEGHGFGLDDGTTDWRRQQAALLATRPIFTGVKQ